MNKGKRYKKQEKRLNNFLIFYLIIVLFTFVNYTFSRYTATTESTATIEVAKFNIVVNDKKLGQEEKFNLLLSSAENVYNNKLVPDTEGYFEIAINPDETHVSLEYEIAFDLTEINSEIINENNETRNITLTGYSIDDGNTIIDMPTNNIITGEINLEENSTGFLAEDTVTLKVFWEWKQDIINPTFENSTIQVTSTIKQKVTNGSENVE